MPKTAGLTKSLTRGLTQNLFKILEIPLNNTKSLNFDVTDAVATTTYTPSTIHSTGLTMSFWCKMGNFSGFQIMGNWDDKGIFAGFDNSGRPDAYFGVQNIQKATTDISSYVSVGTWHHICVTASGASGVGTYYVDGVARDTLSYTADASKASITPIAIGALQQSTGLAYYMEGDIDEVAFFSSALTASEVNELYNNGQPTDLISYSTLEAWYRMGDATVPAADGTSNLLFDQTNGGLSSELTIANPYAASAWTTYGNTVSNPSTNSIRVARGASGGSNSALQTSLASGGILTGNVTVGKTYKLTFDFETDETSGTIALARFYDGSSYTTLQTGSGSVDYYFTAANAGLALGAIELSPNQYVQFSNISFKEVQNAGTISGATIQTEAPKAIMGLPPVDNTKSLNFDGGDDQVLLPVALPSTFSVSFWFKQSDTANGEYLFDSRNSSDQAFAAWSTYDSGTNSHVITVWCGTTVVGTTKVPVGTWAHVALTKNGNTVSIYVDGVFDNSGTNATFATTTTSDIKVGTRYTGGNAWQGNMDEWAIWGVALSAENVRALYNGGRPIDISSGHGAYDQGANLLHWWRMGDATNDGTGNLIYDQAGSGNATMTNMDAGSDIQTDTPY